MSKTCILFFLKYPELGCVKTRLARSVGDASAVEAFRWMVEHCWDTVKTVEANRQIFGAPAEKIQAFDLWLKGGLPATPQASGNLGDRLIASVQEAFAEGHTKIICVGGDCPSLQAQDYAQAIEALEHHDLAINPAQDGGYVLVGLNAPHIGIFQDIAWSTDLVFQQTIERAQSMGLKAWVGKTFSDIDTFEDWQEIIQSEFPEAPNLRAHA